MPNRLATATSPYLLQHKDNPVDWYPWGPEAFEKARREDKPIFLSVGYSACHWCHVMERESFENPDIARILNEHFVSIKVDREERPDIDQVYMQAVQMMTGSGGWPMSVFMTPDGRPFFAGTYWPPESKWGRPGFDQVLNAVAEAWKTKRADIEKQSVSIVGQLQEMARGPQASGRDLSAEWIAAADRWLQENFDSRWGGFGHAPKFPQAIDLSLLIELEATAPDPQRRQVIVGTLDGMARGGIYDHLGGGFARYSVDDQWLVPHFEKMLYDNALLAVVYADAYRLWGEAWMADVLRGTLDYVVRDMRHPQGAFFSSEDADSEGVEGKFYVWDRQEILNVLGEEQGSVFCQVYGVTDRGNFEGHNILHLPRSIPQAASDLGLPVESLQDLLADARHKLLQRREQRVRPGRDDKVLLSWNALMIGGLVHGYRAVGDSRYLQAARQAAAFLRMNLTDGEGRLLHAWKDGQASAEGFLEDYGYMIEALVALFQVDSQAEHLQWAIELAETMIDQFADPAGGFFFTARSAEPLVARSKDLMDSSVPSAAASAARGLLLLGRITGRDDFLQQAESGLRACTGVMINAPQAAAHALRGLHLCLHPPEELVLVVPDLASCQPVVANMVRPLWPTRITVVVEQAQAADVAALSPLLQGRCQVEPEPRLYICQGFACQTPVVGAEQIESALHAMQPRSEGPE
ncbi:MAG: thioredoxin domain-containing protein [Planctomycetota bacterium]|nr:MAG: thioredoxin domain-containing protein [Planctomycetota bacterium]